MTRLTDVVRGVEEKEEYSGAIYADGTLDENIEKEYGISRRAHNNLASAEVVVDREKIRQIIDTSTENCIAENMTVEEVVACNTNAVYAALNSGSIISLKGE